MRSPRSSSDDAPPIADQIRSKLTESIQTKERIIQNLIPAIEGALQICLDCLESGHKIFLFGNGGSAADSQHIAAELVGKMALHRKALPAIALTTDTSNLTALSNDFGYEVVFQRQLEALGQSGDVAVGLSTSGRSPNVLAGIRKAREMGLKTIGLTGGDGGALKDLVDCAIVVPSHNTQRIQEAHITIAHILCELIEAHFANR
jgi:D-sedoheptulose 7-phosphate isomerase